VAANPEIRDRFRGVILGTAVGDALGLPAEGLSPRRARRLFPGPWTHRFLGRWGMVSDDTEHTVFVAQSLLAHPASPDRFARRLGWCLRGWLLTLPAGVGLATLRSCLRLWIGVPPSRSGVWSAGNGAAMRVAPIGAFFADALDRLPSFVAAATRITHTDPKALTAAMAVASLAAWAIRERVREQPEFPVFLELLRQAGPEDPAWLEILRSIEAAYSQDLPVEEFACRLGLERGVTGYAYHTVPVVVYAWFRHCGDFAATLTAVLNCGGDADTTGAIAGALAGAVTGASGIPREWLDGIIEWPRDPQVLSEIADRLADQLANKPTSPVQYFWPGLIPRNLLFLLIVLLHGFRRLVPPY
jgi:ADP-ribosyl-[dinitrogen reductase] hydrolase